MSKYLTGPIPFTDYILDPATDNPHLQIRKMPSGLLDSQKREWLNEESIILKAVAQECKVKYQQTGLYVFLSLCEALIQESNECKRAAKRKYIERLP